MSENDQPQEPLNTRMSDETGGVEIQSIAKNTATTTEGQEWQIHDFGEILNLGELDRYMPFEIQHILALSYANVLSSVRICLSRNTCPVNG